MSAGRKIVAAEGTKGLMTGFGPTAVGYFFQGGAKFAGYEFFVRSLYILHYTKGTELMSRKRRLSMVWVARRLLLSIGLLSTWEELLSPSKLPVSYLRLEADGQILC
jgi:hypothetical protein